MRLKRVLLSTLVAGMMVLTACAQSGPDYTVWIPDQNINDLNLGDDKVVTQSSRVIPSEEEYTSVDELAKKLLNHEDISEAVYKNQLINGSYEDLSEAISGKRTIIYVSSSEGNNLNDGRTPATPKKSFEKMSQSAGVAVLLKCGDTFEMSDMFYVGDNTVFCSYGEGPRPILDFSQKVEEPLVNVRGYENIWAVDLSRTVFYNKEKSDESNYNFGQLYLDDECNWNRLVVSSKDMPTANFAELLTEQKDNCWAVDWMHGVLYLYSETDPNEHEIRLSSARHGLNFKEIRNAIVSDIEIKGTGVDGAILTNCTDVTITNCLFKNIGGALAGGTTRYGDGIRLGNVEKNITIKNNVFDNVFSSGYCDKGLAVTDRQENIVVTGNIFAHCNSGIEQYDDYQCLVPIKGMSIENNLVFETCDVTNPSFGKYVDDRGTMTNGLAEVPSYRNDTLFNKSASATFAAYQSPKEVKISNNVFWGTTRFLMLIDATHGYPEISDNYFFSRSDSERDCLFGYGVTTDAAETMFFAKQLLEDTNTETVVVTPQDSTDLSYISNDAMQQLKKVLGNIVGE